MFSFLQKKKVVDSAESYCIDHEYALLKKKEREIWIEELGRLFPECNYYIYCPKCRTRKTVSALEWDLIQREQECNKRYMEKHGIIYLEREGKNIMGIEYTVVIYTDSGEISKEIPVQGGMRTAERIKRGAEINLREGYTVEIEEHENDDIIEEVTSI